MGERGEILQTLPKNTSPDHGSGYQPQISGLPWNSLQDVPTCTLKPSGVSQRDLLDKIFLQNEIAGICLIKKDAVKGRLVAP